MARRLHLLVVEARFYDDISDALAEGCIAALDAAQATYERVNVPGALEIPLAIGIAAETDRFDGYVALGCVIRGETTHYDTVSNESARGIMDLGVGEGLAIGNGILTVENEDQAWARARRSGEDKGGGAARAALSLIALRRQYGLDA